MLKTLYRRTKDNGQKRKAKVKTWRNKQKRNWYPVESRSEWLRYLKTERYWGDKIKEIIMFHWTHNWVRNISYNNHSKFETSYESILIVTIGYETLIIRADSGKYCIRRCYLLARGTLNEGAPYTHNITTQEFQKTKQMIFVCSAKNKAVIILVKRLTDLDRELWQPSRLAALLACAHAHSFSFFQLIFYLISYISPHTSSALLF